MIPADAAIQRLRRDLTVSALLRGTLITVAVLGSIVPGLIGLQGAGMILLLVVGAAWLYLSYQSVQNSRAAAEFPHLIAAGRFDLAERQIERSLQSFSLFRNAKLLSIHHLAMLRHAQKRWGDVAVLCRALLGERLGSLGGLSKSSRLILADALLEMGDLRGAYQVLSELYRQRLSLTEALNLLAVQTDYELRLGAWPSMMSGIRTKAQLADLMPTEPSARLQAQLALAARKTGKTQWASFLLRRVELIADVQKLCAQRPMLWELWQMPDA